MAIRKTAVPPTNSQPMDPTFGTKDVMLSCGLSGTSVEHWGQAYARNVPYLPLSHFYF